MKTMSNEVRKEFVKFYGENADKQMSLSTVFDTTAAYLVGKGTMAQYSADAMFYASLIGTNKRDPQRKVFMDEFMHQMPGVKFLGSDKWVVCDMVRKELDKMDHLNQAIVEYRLPDIKVDGEWAHQECVHVNDAIAYITVNGQEVKKTMKVKVDYGNGYTEEIEIPVKKSAKEYEMETTAVYYQPKPKTVWGYTDQVMNAMIAALEVLANE